MLQCVNELAHFRSTVDAIRVSPLRRLHPFRIVVRIRSRYYCSNMLPIQYWHRILATIKQYSIRITVHLYYLDCHKCVYLRLFRSIVIFEQLLPSRCHLNKFYIGEWKKFEPISILQPPTSRQSIRVVIDREILKIARITSRDTSSITK